MLVQAAATSRVPVPSSAIPVQYAETAAAASVALWEAEFSRVPIAIREEMCQPFTDEAGLLVRFGYRIGSLAWLTDGEGSWPGFTGAFGAIYQSAIPVDLYSTSKRAAVRSDQSGGAGPLVHEFGHHIDQAFRRIRGLDSQWLPNTGLRFHAPFSTIWQQVNASIPSALYGATNILEWIAEQFRCQIHGDGVTYLQLMGSNRAAADTIRAEWLSMFPTMPALTY